MDTALVVAECWLFRTRFEGICTRDTVPGSAYIRDTRTDEMFYSAQAGDTKEEDQDEEMDRPTHVEAEVSPKASSPRPYHRRAHPGSAKSLMSNAEARSKSVHAGNASWWGSISANTATRGCAKGFPAMRRGGSWQVQGTSTWATSPPPRARPLPSSLRTTFALPVDTT